MTKQPVTTDEISAFAERLIHGGLAGDDGARIDAIRALEELKCVSEGRQARETAALDASQRRRAADAGAPVARQGRGIDHQVALARRESPHRGQRHVGLARVLDREMPHTHAALVGGYVTEWRATILARETACLPVDHRRRVDWLLAADAGRLAEMSDREVVDRCRRAAADLDPAAVAERRRRAESERNVTIRPAPDTMAFVSALLPVTDAVATYAALKHAADEAVGTGRATSRGQAMADTLVARVTGRDPVAEPSSIRLNLVMTDEGLLHGSNDPVHLDGWGPVPAELAREMIARSLDSEDARATLRRLFTAPDSDQLVAMESHSRLFPRGLAELIRLRDQHCRSPWCDAPIRHTDHITSYGEGGPTSLGNGQGLCEACNHAKQAAGWAARVIDFGRHVVETTIPTGHTYRSKSPPVSGPPPPFRLELGFAA